MTDLGDFFLLLLWFGLVLSVIFVFGLIAHGIERVLRWRDERQAARYWDRMRRSSCHTITPNQECLSGCRTQELGIDGRY